MILNVSAAMSRQRRAPALGPVVSVLLVGWCEAVVLAVRPERDLPQASEGSGQGECPGPVLSQAGLPKITSTRGLDR